MAVCQIDNPKREVLGSAGHTSFTNSGSSYSWNVGEPFIGTAISVSGKVLTQGFEQPDLLFQSCFDFYVTKDIDCNNVTGSYVVILTIAGGYPSQPNNGYLVTSTHPGGYNGIIYGSFVDGPFPNASGYNYTIQVLDNLDCSQSISQEIVDCAPTPITLLSFDGKVKKDGNSLFWETASEIDCDFYELFRSIDGDNFEKIHSTECLGNNSTTTTLYDFLDLDVPNGYTYYQLHQFDVSGEMHLSNVVILYREKSNESPMGAIAVYPNPVSDILNVNFDPEHLYQFTLRVYDVSGKAIYEKYVSDLDGQMTVNLSHLPNGLYMVSFYNLANKLLQANSIRKIK